MEISKQVAKDKDIVNISNLDNLNFELWKYENKKNLIREIDADKKLKLGILDLLPDFDNLVTLYEIKWLKSRNNFNIIEQDIVTNEFKKLYAKRINKLMGDK